MALPTELKYSETHEWVRVSERKDPKGKAKPEIIGTIGITDFAVQQLSDLVHLDLPDEGEILQQGNAFGEIESVKTVAELVAPISGKVIEVNKDALKHVDLVMEEPFEDGWLVRVQMKDKSELDALMSARDYKQFVKTSEEEEGVKKGEEEEIDDGFFM